MAVALFKCLAQKVHNSVFCEARINRELKKHNECEDKFDGETPIVYQKNIQSVATRWTSTCMLIESALNLLQLNRYQQIQLWILVRFVLELNQSILPKTARLYANLCWSSKTLHVSYYSTSKSSYYKLFTISNHLQDTQLSNLKLRLLIWLKINVF